MDTSALSHLVAAGTGALSWAGLDVLVLAPTPTWPLDAGNRNRIYHVNAALQRLGARITFVHYAVEGDWRTGVPPGAIRAMQEQWEICHTVPPTCAPHPGAQGEDHGIDEWWDPGIGHMLAWLFRTHCFDVFIVNYAWLSNAFTFCPHGVLKVLDTHDRFSGRRELLARHGITAEFFHTTEEQERIALNRADVVWSIKHDEATFFRTLTRRRVVNLPYAPPLPPMVPRRDDHRVLRFGIAGAANSINLANMEAFLAEADDYIRHTLLPCEIVIAGSICDLLGHVRHPWVRLLGRLPDMATFYADVDAVLAPIAFSTGLKIKVGEALSHGRAVLALEHAFEGFQPAHPFHRLGSLRDMMRACRALVNDPALLDELERLSLRVVLQTRVEVEQALEETLAELWRGSHGVCIVVQAADVFRGSLVVDHAREAAHYIGHLVPIVLFVDGEAGLYFEPEALVLLAEAGTLVLEPALAQAMGPYLAERLGLRVLRTRALSDLVREPHLAFWFASRPQSWPVPAVASTARAYVACDSVLQATAPAELVVFLDLLRASFSTVVTTSRGLMPPADQPGMASWRYRVPLLWRGARSPVLADQRTHRREAVVVLADAADDPLLVLVVPLVLRLCTWRVDIVLPAGAPADAAPPDWLDPARVAVLPASRCFCPRSPDAPGAVLVVDLATDFRLASVREVYDRLYVPSVTLFAEPVRPASGAWAPPSGVVGLFDSILLLTHLLDNPPGEDAVAEQRGWGASYINDAGWAWIWGEIRDLVAARDSAAPVAEPAAARPPTTPRVRVTSRSRGR